MSHDMLLEVDLGFYGVRPTRIYSSISNIRKVNSINSMISYLSKVLSLIKLRISLFIQRNVYYKGEVGKWNIDKLRNSERTERSNSKVYKRLLKVHKARSIYVELLLKELRKNGIRYKEASIEEQKKIIRSAKFKVNKVFREMFPDVRVPTYNDFDSYLKSA